MAPLGFDFRAAVLLVVVGVVVVALSMQWPSGWSAIVPANVEGMSATGGGTSVAVVVSAAAGADGFCRLSEEARSVSHNA